MSFAMWECGHRHQAGKDGRVEFCIQDIKPTWYMLEVGAETHGYVNGTGLHEGDFTLHSLHEDGTYSPAHRHQASVTAWELAHASGRRLMYYSPGDHEWKPVIANVKPASSINRWGEWPPDVEPLLRQWNKERRLRFATPPWANWYPSKFKCAVCGVTCEAHRYGRAELDGRAHCDDCLIGKAREVLVIMARTQA